MQSAEQSAPSGGGGPAARLVVGSSAIADTASWGKIIRPDGLRPLHPCKHGYLLPHRGRTAKPSKSLPSSLFPLHCLLRALFLRLLPDPLIRTVQPVDGTHLGQAADHHLGQLPAFPVLFLAPGHQLAAQLLHGVGAGDQGGKGPVIPVLQNLA